MGVLSDLVQDIKPTTSFPPPLPASPDPNTRRGLLSDLVADLKPATPVHSQAVDPATTYDPNMGQDDILKLRTDDAVAAMLPPESMRLGNMPRQPEIPNPTALPAQELPSEIINPYPAMSATGEGSIVQTDRPLISPAPRNLKDEFGAGLSRGVSQVGAMGHAGLGMVADVTGNQELGDAQMKQAQQLAQWAARPENKATMDDVRKIRSVKDAIHWAAGVTGEQIPIMGTMALGGAAGGGVGVGAAAIGMETTGIYQDIAQQTGERGGKSATIALGHGTLAGALDTLPIMRIFKRMGVAGTVKKSVVRRLAQEGILKTIGKEGAKQLAFEGGTEGLQTIIERSALKWVDENAKVFDEEGLTEIINATAAGAFLGLAGGVVSAPGVKIENQQKRRELAAPRLDLRQREQQAKQTTTTDIGLPQTFEPIQTDTAPNQEPMEAQTEQIKPDADGWYSVEVDTANAKEVIDNIAQVATDSQTDVEINATTQGGKTKIKVKKVEPAKTPQNDSESTNVPKTTETTSQEEVVEPVSEKPPSESVGEQEIGQATPKVANATPEVAPTPTKPQEGSPSSLAERAAEGQPQGEGAIDPWNRETSDYPIADQALKEGKAVVTEMTPYQYIDEASKLLGIPEDEKYKGINYSKVQKYMLRMKRGDKFPMLVLEHGTENQEGRHRALAAEEYYRQTGQRIMVPVVEVNKPTQPTPISPKPQAPNVETPPTSPKTSESPAPVVKQSLTTAPTEEPSKPATAGEQAGKTKRYTSLPVGAEGLKWYSFAPGNIKLKKGQRFTVNNRKRNTIPTEIVTQFEKVPKRAEALLNAVKTKTDEVVPLDGKEGRNFVLVPKQVLAELKKEGMDIDAEVKAGHDAQAEFTKAWRAKRQKSASKFLITKDMIEEDMHRRLTQEQIYDSSLIKGAKKSSDPELIVWGEILDHMKKSKKVEYVNPEDLPDGTKIKNGSHTFKVQWDTDPFTGQEEVYLANAITVPGENVRVPAEKIVKPDETTKPAKIDTGQDAKPGEQLGLLGRQYRTQPTGKQQSLGFDEPSQIGQQAEKKAIDDVEGQQVMSDEPTGSEIDIAKEARAWLKGPDTGWNKLKTSLVKSTLERYEKGEATTEELQDRLQKAKVSAVKMRVERNEKNAAEKDGLQKAYPTTEAKQKRIVQINKELDKAKDKSVTGWGINGPLERLAIERTHLESMLDTESEEGVLAEPKSTLGSPDVLGDYVAHEIDRGRISTSAENLTKRRKPMSATEIIAQIKADFNLTIRGKSTHAMRKYLGWYDSRAKGIRLKQAAALTTAMHEIGHWIDWKLNNRLSKNPPSKAIADELLTMGKALYGKRNPPGGYKSEGWAEFVRKYLTEDKPESAPATLQWFLNDYLPANPPVEKKLNATRERITQWRLQGAAQRINSQLVDGDYNPPVKQRIRETLRKIITTQSDVFHPLLSGMKDAGINLAELEPIDNPHLMAHALANASNGVIRSWAIDGMTSLNGQIIGPSLLEVLAPVADDYDSFRKWAIAKKTMQLASLGIESGISQADAKYIIDSVTGDTQKVYESVLDGWTNWSHAGLDYAVEAGALSSDVAQHIKDKHSIYIPLMRAFEKGEVRRSGTGKGMGQQASVVKKIKGSGRPIIDPLKSSLQNMQKLIETSHKAMVVQSLARLANRGDLATEGIAGLIWKVPAPMAATKFSAEQIKKDIIRIAQEKLGLDLSEGIPSSVFESWGDDLLTVFSESSQYYGKDNIIPIKGKDGKRQWYEVNKDLFSLLKGMEVYRLPRALDFILGVPTRMVRLGATGLKASFGLTLNPTRDLGTFAVTSKHAQYGPLSGAAGIFKEFIWAGNEVTKKFGLDLQKGKEKASQRFESLGGTMAIQVVNDRGVRHLRSQVLASNGKRYILNTFMHPVDALVSLFSIPEAGTRVSEAEEALKYGEAKWGEDSVNAALYSLYAGKDVTSNFTVAGAHARVLNQIIPFYNAAIRGPEKILRTFKERPVAATLNGLLWLTVPALLSWWRYKDEEWFKSLADWEKFGYIHFQNGNIVNRIPVPFEIGHMFQTLPMAALDSWYNKDPETFQKAFGYALETNNPLGFPAAIVPWIEIWKNEDFTGKPIVNQSVARKLPEDQYGPYTTELMKGIGRAFGLSPAKTEHVVNSYTGGLYKRMARLVEKSDKEKVPADLPVIGPLFVRDPFAPRAQIETFYANRDKYQELNYSKKISPRDNEKRLWYNRTSRELSPYWKQLMEAKTESDRKRVYDRIRGIVEQVERVEQGNVPARRSRKKNPYL